MQLSNNWSCEANASFSDDRDRDALMAGLRSLKKKTALAVGLADLGGWWSASRVGEALSETSGYRRLSCAPGICFWTFTSMVS